MSVVHINIQSLKDAKEGVPLFTDINSDDDFTELDTLHVGIIEKGTTGGQDVVMFKLNGSEGKPLLVQITANQMHTIHVAFKGAQHRFKKEENG